MHIPIPHRKKRFRIEIIPLIDIMFFLLATFMMVSLSMVKNQGLNVHLPQSTSVTPLASEQSTTIGITDSGDYFWNRDSVSAEELVARLAEFHGRAPGGGIVISCDRQTQFEKVVRVLDEARQAGIVKVGVRTSIRP